MLCHDTMLFNAPSWHSRLVAGPIFSHLRSISKQLQLQTNSYFEWYLCTYGREINITFLQSARSLNTCDICGIVLCDKTEHFRVAFYCGQPKAHLCNNHAV